MDGHAGQPHTSSAISVLISSFHIWYVKHVETWCPRAKYNPNAAILTGTSFSSRSKPFESITIVVTAVFSIVRP